MKKEVVLVLPNIRSAHNVGAMFRTADGAGIDRIYLVGYTPNPPHPRLDKVSLGSEKWIPWEKSARLGNLLNKLKKKGYNIVALEKTKNSSDIFKTKFKKPLALVVGNEKTGISRASLKKCDQIVHIPMYGKKISLNVSVAAGVGMYQITKNKK